MMIPTLMVATASGAVLGSAAGSALVRWPQGGSVASPRRSRCAACGAVVQARDLIPVVSWLLLLGRCRRCGASIDGRLPLLETASAIAAMSVVHVHGVGLRAALLVVGAVAALLAVLTDLESLTIPDRLTWPLVAIALPGMLALSDGPSQRSAILGWAVALPVLVESAARSCVRLGWRRPIGGGDVKLLAGLLALADVATAGPPRLLALALVLGGVHAAGGLLLGRLRLGQRLPFAPAIAAAFLTVVLSPGATFPVTHLLEVLR